MAQQERLTAKIAEVNELLKNPRLMEADKARLEVALHNLKALAGNSPSPTPSEPRSQTPSVQ